MLLKYALEGNDIICKYFIPEYIAASLYFGYSFNHKFKTLNDEQLILLIDMGYITINSTLVLYKKDCCEIKSHYFDNTLGSRVIDQIITNYIINSIRNEYNVDVHKYSEVYIQIKHVAIQIKETFSKNKKLSNVSYIYLDTYNNKRFL